MRPAPALVLSSLVVLVTVAPASAQRPALRPVNDAAAFGLFVGYGFGPGPSAMVGVDAQRPLVGPVGVRVGYSRWEGAIGRFCLEPPFGPNTCDAVGNAVLGGAVLYLPGTRRVAPYVAFDAGGFSRVRGFKDSDWAPAAAGGAGVRASLGDRWSARLGAKTLHIFDDVYESSTGEPLRYYVATLGLTFGINR